MPTPARRIRPTLLSLPEYARIMGINPVHFYGGTASAQGVWPSSGECEQVWPRHTWQMPSAISQEEISEQIYKAEKDIAGILGWWPAPIWTKGDEVPFPVYYRREYKNVLTRQINGASKTVRARLGRIISPGRRAVTQLGNVTAVYSDEDGDGYNETATVTLAGITDTVDPCEVKIYYEGYLGDPAWEIREPHSKTLVAGTLTAVFDSWLFVSPSVMSRTPTQYGFEAIDMTNAANLVTEVDVYYEYNDPTQASSEFIWKSQCSYCGSVGCDACQNQTQTGCFHVVDWATGIVAPFPATYDDDNSQWVGVSSACKGNPYSVRLWYKSGNIGQDYLDGYAGCSQMEGYLAQMVAELATARLEHPPCSCTYVYTRGKELQEDLVISSPQGNFAVAVDDLIKSTLGTRRGEVNVWRKLEKIVGEELLEGVLV